MFDVIVSVFALLATVDIREWLSVALRDGQDGIIAGLVAWAGGLTEVAPGSHEVLIAYLIPVWAVAAYSSESSDFRLSWQQTAARVARFVGLGMAMLIALSFLLKLSFLSRTFVILLVPVQFAFLMTGRFLLMQVLALFRGHHVDGHRVVIVGRDAGAMMLSKALLKESPWNIRILGHLTVDDQLSVTEAPKSLGHVEDLPDLLDRMPVDEVVFASSHLEQARLAVALEACDVRGVDILLPLPPAVPSHGKVEVAQLDGVRYPLLGLRRTPTGELRVVAKRIMDLLVGGTMLLFAAPVMIFTALAIKIESRGPVLFRQTRVGKHGRKFTMYKFRSMVVDAEAKKKELMHLNEMSGPVFKISRDPRITRVGGFIRKTSIDELPQLFNIVFGSMSLVGPRPPLPSEVEQYKAWQRRRLSVKPGLTGLWQVSGRSALTNFDDWLKLDLRYIDDWSLWLDLKIILRTVPAVLRRAGAS